MKFVQRENGEEQMFSGSKRTMEKHSQDKLLFFFFYFIENFFYSSLLTVEHFVSSFRLLYIYCISRFM